MLTTVKTCGIMVKMMEDYYIMTSKYLRQCKSLMQLKHQELAEMYKHVGFPYCGKSKRRKLRMASRIVIYRHGPNFVKKTAIKRIKNTVKILVRNGQI